MAVAHETGKRYRTWTSQGVAALPAGGKVRNWTNNESVVHHSQEGS
jgi:hypothetical protein